MSEQLTHAIACALLASSNVTTTEQLADRIGVSVRAVKSRLDDVAAVLAEHDLVLTRRRGQGVAVSGEARRRHECARLLERSVRKPFLPDERFLFTLGTLLLSESGCRITDLSTRLFLSRPTVYQILADVSDWLADFDITIGRAQRGALELECGEKRRRLALRHWVVLVEDFVTRQHDNASFKDVLGLGALIRTFEEHVPLAQVRKILGDVNSRADVYVSGHAEAEVARTFQVSLVRYLQGHPVVIPARRIALHQDQSGIDSTLWLRQSVAAHCGIDLPVSEATYLYTYLLLYEPLATLDQFGAGAFDVPISDDVLQQIRDYLAANLRLSAPATDGLMRGITTLLRTVLTFQINERHPPDRARYQEILARFYVLDHYAGAICDLIVARHAIFFRERFQYHLTLLLTQAVEASKRRLVTALLHDGNRLEKSMLHRLLRRHLPVCRWIKPAEFTELSDQFLHDRGVDLVITTTQVETSLPVVPIPQVATMTEFDDVVRQVRQHYEEINFHRILVNPPTPNPFQQPGRSHANVPV